jgi:hypothetical protein
LLEADRRRYFSFVLGIEDIRPKARAVIGRPAGGDTAPEIIRVTNLVSWATWSAAVWRPR